LFPKNFEIASISDGGSSRALWRHGREAPRASGSVTLSLHGIARSDLMLLLTGGAAALLGFALKKGY